MKKTLSLLLLTLSFSSINFNAMCLSHFVRDYEIPSDTYFVKTQDEGLLLCHKWGAEKDKEYCVKIDHQKTQNIIAHNAKIKELDVKFKKFLEKYIHYANVEKQTEELVEKMEELDEERQQILEEYILSLLKGEALIREKSLHNSDFKQREKESTKQEREQAKQKYGTAQSASEVGFQQIIMGELFCHKELQKIITGDLHKIVDQVYTKKAPTLLIRYLFGLNYM